MRAWAVASLVACTAGCASDDAASQASSDTLPNVDEWRSIGYDAHNTRHNRGEHQLDTANVSGLKPKWLLLDVTIGVTSTPAVVDGIVYFGEWGGTVRAVRAADGTEVWRTPVRGRPRATPLVTDDRVFVASGREVFALNREGGAVLWAKVIDEHPNVVLDSSPIWADGRIVVGVSSYEIGVLKEDYTFRGNIVALDPEHAGDELWRVYVSENDATSGAGVSVWSSAAVDRTRKMVFIGTGNTYEQPASPRSDAIVAIKYETGEVRWVTQFTEGDVFTVPKLGPGVDADIGASPNLFRIGSRDVVGAGSKAGLYKALDRDTGDVVWEVTLGRGSPLGGIMSTSAVDDAHVYVSSNGPGGSVTAAFRQEDGSTAWEAPLPSPVYGALTLANGVLYQPTHTGVAYALEASSGAVLWQADLQSDLGGGISVVGGSIYVPRGFEFLSATHVDAGGLVAFSLDGAQTLDFTKDAGTDAADAGDAGAVTVAQCLAAAPATLSTACRECTCNCDAAAMAACGVTCWDFYFCITTSCSDQFSDASADASTGAGACVAQACTDAKLVPGDVQAATQLAAPCMVRCSASCGD
jgi:polyvinyl alcohol dehydrogenase (cytochrome)